jgi:hypothetical protein
MESVAEPDLGDPEDSGHFRDIPFDLRDQILGRPDPPRIQRGSQGSGQSAGNGGNDVIEGCRIFGAGQLSSVLILVETFDPPMHPELDRSREWLHAGGSVRTFMFFDPNATGVGYGHDTPPWIQDFAFWAERDTVSIKIPSIWKTAPVYRKI